VLVNGIFDYKLTKKIRHIAYDIEFEYNFDIDFQVIVRSKKWWEDWKNALPFAQNIAKEGVWL
jgi:uncharacterized protein (DUF1697 family)